MGFIYRIRLSGAGGHGLKQAARILAEAAAIYEGRDAAESCSFGPEARGNTNRADVVISDEAIEYPRVEKVDFLMALTQESYDRYCKDVAPGGVVLMDRHIVTAGDTEGMKIYPAPIIDVAVTECRRPSMISISALGFFAGLNGVIGEESTRLALLARVPKNSEDIYIEVYEAGLERALKMDKR